MGKIKLNEAVTSLLEYAKIFIDPSSPYYIYLASIETGWKVGNALGESADALINRFHHDGYITSNNFSEFKNTVNLAIEQRDSYIKQLQSEKANLLFEIMIRDTIVLILVNQLKEENKAEKEKTQHFAKMSHDLLLEKTKREFS